MFKVIAANNVDPKKLTVESKPLDILDAVDEALRLSKAGYRAVEVVSIRPNPHDLQQASALLRR